MFNCKNLLQPRTRSKSCPVVKIPKVKQVIESFTNNGLVTSFLREKEFTKFDDEHQHFRDYGIQTLLAAQATELLQPMPSVNIDALKASDSAALSTVAIGRIYDEFKSSVSQPVLEVKEVKSE